MTIVADCPHCERRFTLQAELVGREMRCPNVDCREVFTVHPATPAPPQPPAGKAWRTGSLTRKAADFVPVVDAIVVPPPLPPEPKATSPRSATADGDIPAFIDAEPVEPTRPATAPPAPPQPPRPRPPKKRRPEPEVIDAVVVPNVIDAVVVTPPSVKEVVWTPDAEVPGSPSVPAATEEPNDEPIFIPRRRKKKKKWPVYFLIGMASVIVIALGWTVLYGLKRIGDAETRLAQEAAREYKAGEYAAAAKSYGQLLAEFPSSESRSKYEFFAELATLQRDVRSVTTRDEPGPAIAKVLGFVESRKDSPWMQSDGGAADLVSVGRKVADDAAGHAEDRIRDYRSDRSRSNELKRASDALARGRELLVKLEPLRATADEPFDGLRLRFDQIARDIDTENRRNQGLAEIRELIARPTDGSVETARAKLVEYGLTADSEAVGLVNDASGRLGRLVRYTTSPASPVTPPAAVPGALAFVGTIGSAPPLDVVQPGDRVSGVFLAHAKGVVYALDQDSGAFLWACRIGYEIAFAPTVVDYAGPEGKTPLAIVVSATAGRPGVSAHDLRSGALRWFQPLPALPSGPALVVGTRTYIPLRDVDGTLAEIDLATGQRLGMISLGQAIGPPPIVRPGTGLIYVVAEARRVYVLDVGARDLEGNRLPPRCAQVLLTGHPPGSVRTAPLILGPTGDTPADRWLVLSQVASIHEMQLRSFVLPPFAPPRADGDVPPGVAVGAATTISVPGWSRFPPTTDGERLAIVTDSGEFRLYGVNQPGNRDPVLFPITQLSPPGKWDGPPTPGLAIPADDGGFWMLSNGQEVQQVRIDLHPEKGLLATAVARTPTAGPATLSGIPTQTVVTSSRNRLALFVLQSPESDSHRAVAFDASTGEVRWQRQLGLNHGIASGIHTGDVLLASECGMIHRVPPSIIAAKSELLLGLDDSKQVFEPLDVASAHTMMAASSDRQLHYSLTSYQHRGEHWLTVRMFTTGQAQRNGRVRIASPPSGPAVVLGDAVLYPARDGFVYRAMWMTPHTKDDDGFDRMTVVRGPLWRTGETRNSSNACFLMPLDGDRVAISDGDRTIAVWMWSTGGGEQPTGIRWTLPNPIAFAPLYLAGNNGQPGTVLVADITGSIWHFASERVAEPLHRWKPDSNRVPIGKPTAGFSLHVASDGERWAAYVIEQRHVAWVRLDRPSENAVVCIRGEDKAERVLVGAPQSAGAGRWLVTELGGRVNILDPLQPQQRVIAGEVGLPGVVAVSPAVIVGGSGRAIVPLSDGTAAILSLPE